jgi:hypothetical protein
MSKTPLELSYRRLTSGHNDRVESYDVVRSSRADPLLNGPSKTQLERSYRRILFTEDPTGKRAMSVLLTER